MTSKPKFSIVIPTRERAVTLRHALRTCVEQTYAPLEIVVSDNAGTDDTREVVESFGDARIRYVNTGRRIGMTRNWEFGLSQVTGDYVTFIGDDDGLLPDAVSDVAALMERLGAEAISWTKVDYHWPNHPMEHTANSMLLPLRTSLFACDARRFVTDCASFWTSYAKGPCLYNAFVSTAAVDRVRQRSGGTFFHSAIPDVYSAIALCAGLDRYYYSRRPFGINAASARSNGANTDAFLRNDDRPNETRSFIEESDLPLHPKMPVLIMGSIVALVLESLLQANDHVFGGSLPIDVDRAVTKAVREVAASPSERYDSVIAALLEIYSGNPHGQGVVRAAMRRYPNRPAEPRSTAAGLNGEDAYALDASRVGVTNVYDAASFVAGFLGPYVPPDRITSYSRLSKLVSRARNELDRRVTPYLW